MLDMGKEYVAKCTELGVKAELYTAADQPHGFFNRPPWIEDPTLAAAASLVANGYLTGAGSLKPASDARLTKQWPRTR